MKSTLRRIEFKPQGTGRITKFSGKDRFAFLRAFRRLTQTGGAEIAEAALVLPIVFTFLLGIVWFGRAFQIYSTITQAAQQGAVTAARSTCATCGDTNTDDTTVQSAVFAVMDTASVNHSAIALYMPATPQACTLPDPAPPSGCTQAPAAPVTICRSVVLNPPAENQDPPPPQQCGAIVSFQYPFQMNLPFTSLNMQTINLKAQAQSRMEN